jgi:predicted RecB family endonuclease
MKLPGKEKEDKNGARMVPNSLSTALVIQDQFKDSMAKIMEMRQYAESLQIDGPKKMEMAIQLDADAKNLIKAIKLKVAQVIEVPETFCKTAKGIQKTLTEDIERVRYSVGSKMIDYRKFLDLEREKQQNQIAEANKALQAKLDEQAKDSGVPAPQLTVVPLPPPEKTIRTSTGESVTFKTRWTYEVTNPDSVPRDICDPSHRKIADAVKAGIREISGVRIFETTDTATRG